VVLAGFALFNCLWPIWAWAVEAPPHRDVHPRRRMKVGNDDPRWGTAMAPSLSAAEPARRQRDRSEMAHLTGSGRSVPCGHRPFHGDLGAVIGQPMRSGTRRSAIRRLTGGSQPIRRSTHGAEHGVGLSEAFGPTRADLETAEEAEITDKHSQQNEPKVCAQALRYQEEASTGRKCARWLRVRKPGCFGSRRDRPGWTPPSEGAIDGKRPPGRNTSG
jgi:hypothetical protein